MRCFVYDYELLHSRETRYFNISNTLVITNTSDTTTLHNLFELDEFELSQ